MKFILGIKKEMTQIFNEKSSKMNSVTQILCAPSYVSQIKTVEKDGYSAVQIVFGTKKRLSKPQAGHFKKVSANSTSKEFRVSTEEAATYNIGDKLSVASFIVGDIVNVTGVSKGKGFAGVVKRHGFKGSPASHGHKDQLRMPGSIGATDAARVFKGTRMGGHMGDNQVTTIGLTIEKIDIEANLIYVRGGVPGAQNGFVFLRAEGEMQKDRASDKNKDMHEDTSKEKSKKETQKGAPTKESKTKETVTA